MKKADANDSIGGGLLGRRQMLRMGAGATGAIALAALGYGRGAAFAQEQNAVLLTPALTEGPYFVDELLNRTDLRLDPSNNTYRQGLPLYLAVSVSQYNDGVVTPLSGATVDIWHCDAAGVYSDVASENTAGQQFLRGYQVTDPHGTVRFLTIFPGWYNGRAVHIHSKVRQFDGVDTTYEFSTQFFVDPEITSRIYNSVEPYNSRPNPDTSNATDGIYQGGSNNNVTQSESGARLLLRMAANNSRAVASFHYVLDLSAGSFPGTGGDDGNPNPGPGTPPIGPPPGPGGPPPGPGGPPPGGPPIGPPPGT